MQGYPPLTDVSAALESRALPVVLVLGQLTPCEPLIKYLASPWTQDVYLRCWRKKDDRGGMAAQAGYPQFHDGSTTARPPRLVRR